MIGLLICLLWALVYGLVCLLVIEVVLWALGQFGVGLPGNLANLVRAIAALVVLIYLISCIAGHGPPVIIRD